MWHGGGASTHPCEPKENRPTVPPWVCVQVFVWKLPVAAVLRKPTKKKKKGKGKI